MPHVDDALARYRRLLIRGEKRVAREVIEAYGKGWQVVQKRARDFVERMEAEALRLGVPLSEAARLNPSWPFQVGRLDEMSEHIAREMARIVRVSDAAITAGQSRAVEMGLEHARRLAGEAIADAGVSRRAALTALGSSWSIPHLEGFTSLIGSLADGSPLRALLSVYGAQGVEQVRDGLLRSFILGENPTVAARRVRGAMGGNLTRALRVSRTEFVRAYRTANLRSFQENPQIIAGWTWHSALDSRTCLGCISKHGEFHRTDEILSDHPSGRCAMRPATQSAEQLSAALGLPIEETARPVQSGESWLRGLSADRRKTVMGLEHAEAFDSGAPLQDLVQTRHDPVWGDAIGPAPKGAVTART